MKVALVMLRPDGGKRPFPLNRDITVLGRREDCDLRIPLGDVSRKHCRVVKDYDTVRLEDLGSSNGTFCNGVRIQETVLEAGDTMTVGPVSFVVQVDGSPALDDIQAPVATGAGETAMPSGLPLPAAMAADERDDDGGGAAAIDAGDDDFVAVEDDGAVAAPAVADAGGGDEAEIVENAFIDDGDALLAADEDGDAPVAPADTGGQGPIPMDVSSEDPSADQPQRVSRPSAYDLLTDDAPPNAPAAGKPAADDEDGIDIKIDVEDDRGGQGAFR